MTQSLIKSIRRRLDVIGTRELKPLKIDEKYHPTSIMAYSKNVTIHGVQHSMLLKKLCRQYIESNDLEPIVDTLMSGVGSAGIAAVSKASEPFLPMLWTVFGTVNQIYSVPHGTSLCLRSAPLTKFKDFSDRRADTKTEIRRNMRDITQNIDFIPLLSPCNIMLCYG